MGEHGAVHCKEIKAFAGLCLSHVNIQDIRQIFESIKGKADGKGKFRISKAKSCDPVNGIQKKSPVFEKSEDQTVDRNGKNPIFLPG